MFYFSFSFLTLVWLVKPIAGLKKTVSLFLYLLSITDLVQCCQYKLLQHRVQRWDSFWQFFYILKITRRKKWRLVLTNKILVQKKKLQCTLDFCKACPNFQIQCLAFVHLWNNANIIKNIIVHFLPVACLNMCIYMLEYEKKTHHALFINLIWG